MVRKYSVLFALAIVLAGALCLAQFTGAWGSAAIAETAADDDPVLATMDGEEIRKSQVQETLNSLMNGGYLNDAADYKTALDYLIQTRLLAAKISELGLDQFTAEEEEAFAAEAKSVWEDALHQYIDYFGAPDLDENKVREEAIVYFTNQGVSEESLAKQLKLQSQEEKLQQIMFEGKDVSATEEEIRAIFEQYASQDMASFDGNIGMYEMYQALYGQKFWFVPEGYRGILHILLDVDEELLTAYNNAQAAFEDSKTEDAPDGDAQLKADMDAARQALLDSQKTTVDAIYTRLDNGENFTDLIAEYNRDPGMNNPDTLRNGYNVHKDSLIFDPSFTAGAFSEKMAQPGDVSDPVVGSSGIHILYYLRDVPAGMVELDDSIRAEIREYVENNKMNQIFAEELAKWQASHDIVYNQEAIYALVNETVTAE